MWKFEIIERLCYIYNVHVIYYYLNYENYLPHYSINFSYNYHITVKSDRHGVLLDTDDNSILSKLQPLFDEKVEAPEAAPDFFYFIDITINDTKERWQYSEEGFIRNYEEGFSMIYLVRDVAEFNKIAKIRSI